MFCRLSSTAQALANQLNVSMQQATSAKTVPLQQPRHVDAIYDLYCTMVVKMSYICLKLQLLIIF